MANKGGHEKPCCKEDEPKEKKLIKATDLPIHGNPFPPKDALQNEHPGLIESKVHSIRASLQPIILPLASAYEKTSDFFSIGYAHGQSALDRLSDNQNIFLNAIIMTSAGILGYGLARKRGIYKRVLLGSIFFTGAAAVCYPKDVEERAQVAWYIAKNKLPEVARQQYVKFTQGNTSLQQRQNNVETEKPVTKD